MAASALNPFLVACLLALAVASAGLDRSHPAAALYCAARTQPDPAGGDPRAQETRPCHSNNGWSGHLCKDVCEACGFSRYDFALPNTATGDMARCCCCPEGDKHACLHVKS
ncbi:hypothetical protein BS78_04G200900 [Paspalum vaginatum]|nr:hypothetical protein BS78_04G200900 [Paspalum vaginatum]